MILDVKEKSGGRVGSNSALNYLSSLMFELGAVDLGYAGAKFTWCNKRWGRGSIRERLDRGIANMEWRMEFPRATVLHLGAVNSDHCPLLIDTNPVDVRCPRTFCFEAMWAEDARCYDLRKWNKEVFGHVQVRIAEFPRNIEKIQLEDPTEGKFQEMFTAEEIGSNELEDIIALSITAEENSLLCQVPTPTKIKNVLFGCAVMQSLKSSGSDGLPPLFYKKYWKVVGHSVIKAVHNFFISGRWIAENQLIVQEILHSFKKRKVAMALPVYTFSSSDVPNTICDKLDASIRRFWWNPNRESGKFLAWKAWDGLCVPKALGGLGFWCAKQFNAALLAKLTWMIVSGRESPCMNALRSKYKVVEDWINREPLKNSSHTWRAIERLKPIIRKGACFIIGDAWRIGVLEEMFDQVSVSAIMRISLPLVPRPDELAWVADSKGVFSVKSVLLLLQNHTWPAAPDPIWKKLWKCRMHERLRTLVWRIGSGVLPTNLNFFTRMAKGDPCCPLCKVEVESVAHLFFKCSETKMFWFGTCWGIRPDMFVVNEDIDVVKLVVDPPIPFSVSGMVKQNLELAAVQIALTLEAIWKFRNQLVHQSKLENPFVSIKALECRIMEHVQCVWSETNLVNTKALNWCPPPCLIVKAWVKQVNTVDPLVAEATAILWVVQIAKVENWDAVCFESDSKLVVECLQSLVSFWSIAGICENVKYLAADFRPPIDARPLSSYFYFSIVHAGSNAIIWTANRNAPMSNSDKLSLTVNGLTVTNQAGKELWSTPPLNSEVAAMQLSETGNLVLVDVRNVTLWESFDYPTDTIVMGQHISAGKSIGKMSYWKLSMDPKAFKNSNEAVSLMVMNDTGLYLLGSDGSTVVIHVVLSDPLGFRIGKEIGLCTRKPLGGTCSCPPGFRSQISGGNCVPMNSSLSLPSACNATRDGSQLNSSISYLRLGPELEMISIPGLPRRFAYEELAAATENFKTHIGSGGFGTVYKGTLTDQTVVAVKKITNLGVQGNREFCTEISIIGNIHHVNLVRLKGFCAQGRQRFLVLEYMNRGSLDSILFGNGPVLEWQERVEIALGTARGLAYLHSGGTRGYLAPEWLTGSPISDKADVYSYGMVLLEIVTGRKNCSFQTHSHITESNNSEGNGLSSYSSGSELRLIYFPLIALQMHERRRYMEVADPRLEGGVTSEEVEKLVRIALCCVHQDPALRPTMANIVGMLEGGLPLSESRVESLNFLQAYGQRFTETLRMQGSNEQNELG
uniref:Protein kinase domain-containing protein n=1 Tax=Fagus sylvatica TaxID=28930 RepID=A0A2N9I911_FAGSY